MSEPQLCPMCSGEGRVFRMTPAYEDTAAQSSGSFGWSGPTHEWRECRICHGSGLLPATNPSLVDLSAPETAKELAEALGVQHEQFLREPESFDTPFQIAQAILTAWRNLRREGGK